MIAVSSRSAVMSVALVNHVNTNSPVGQSQTKSRRRRRKDRNSGAVHIQPVEILNPSSHEDDVILNSPLPISPSDQEVFSLTMNSAQNSFGHKMFFSHPLSHNLQKPSWNDFLSSSMPLTSTSLNFNSCTGADNLFYLLSTYFGPCGYQVCKDLVQQLNFLLPKEMECHPQNDFLFKVDSNDDKVNAKLRDEAIFNLRFLHKFYLSSSDVFANAVNIVDRFIVRVKVKPKYMACVATAAYSIAVKNSEFQEKDRPSADDLVAMARCGGSAKDLERMEAIIRSKLNGCLESVVTTYTFVEAVASLLSVEEKQNALTVLERCLCCASIYQHRPAALAISLLAQYMPRFPESNASIHPVVYHLADFCQVLWSEVEQCMEHIVQLNAAAIDRRPSSPKRLTWTLSKRTLQQLQRPAVQATTLPSICEDPPAWWEEQEDGLALGRLFVD